MVLEINVVFLKLNFCIIVNGSDKKTKIIGVK